MIFIEHKRLYTMKGELPENGSCPRSVVRLERPPGGAHEYRLLAMAAEGSRPGGEPEPRERIWSRSAGGVRPS